LRIEAELGDKAIYAGHNFRLPNKPVGGSYPYSS
jgi:hypothetical protein